jgi:hypothetical protein
MPGAGQTKPPVTPRLSDRIAIGVLTRTFPPELVDRVLTQTAYAAAWMVLAVAATAWLGHRESRVTG